MGNLKKLMLGSTAWIYRIIIIAVLAAIFFYYDKVSYITAQNFLLSVPVCMAVASALILLFTFIYITFRKGLYNFFSPRTERLIYTAAFVLFGLQLFVCWNTYFVSGWDSNILLKNAYSIAHNTGETLNHDYFSRFPGSLFTEYLFIEIFRLADIIGMTDFHNSIFVILIFQCLISTLTGLLIFKSVKKMSGDYPAAWTGWFLYLILVGTSSWKMVPYSDSFALIFPVLMIYLWASMENNKLIMLKWTLMAAVAFIGFQIKPQVLILFLAVVIIRFLRTNITKDSLITLVQCLIPMSIIVVLLNMGISTLLSDLPFDTNPNQKLGMSHYFMQGLNTSTDGMYSREDTDFSLSFSTTKERSKANLDKGMERLKSLSGNGLLEHIARKTTVNYGNGLFGWGQEDNFYAELLEDKVPGFSPVFKQIAYNNGKYYGIFAIIKQITWFLVLILSLLAVSRRNANAKECLLVITLTLIGLTLKTTLFQSGARDFFTYAPLFIILSAMGLKTIVPGAPKE